MTRSKVGILRTTPGTVLPDYHELLNLIHLPTVKTHIFTTTTGAMKVS
jgi:hypothetical protein